MITVFVFDAVCILVHLCRGQVDIDLSGVIIQVRGQGELILIVQLCFECVLVHSCGHLYLLAPDMGREHFKVVLIGHFALARQCQCSVLHRDVQFIGLGRIICQINSIRPLCAVNIRGQTATSSSASTLILVQWLIKVTEDLSDLRHKGLELYHCLVDLLVFVCNSLTCEASTL